VVFTIVPLYFMEPMLGVRDPGIVGTPDLAQHIEHAA
jgi:hypothetical protein